MTIHRYLRYLIILAIVFSTIGIPSDIAQAQGNPCNNMHKEGRNAAAAGEWAAAVKYYEQALKVTPDCAAIMTDLVAAEGNLPDSESVAAHLARGAQYETLGLPEEAKAAYIAALDLDEKNVAAVAGLERVAASQSDTETLRLTLDAGWTTIMGYLLLIAEILIALLVVMAILRVIGLAIRPRLPFQITVSTFEVAAAQSTDKGFANALSAYISDVLTNADPELYRVEHTASAGVAVPDSTRTEIKLLVELLNMLVPGVDRYRVTGLYYVDGHDGGGRYRVERVGDGTVMKVSQFGPNPITSLHQFVADLSSKMASDIIIYVKDELLARRAGLQAWAEINKLGVNLALAGEQSAAESLFLSVKEGAPTPIDEKAVDNLALLALVGQRDRSGVRALAAESIQTDPRDRSDSAASLAEKVREIAVRDPDYRRQIQSDTLYRSLLDNVVVFKN